MHRCARMTPTNLVSVGWVGLAAHVSREAPAHPGASFDDGLIYPIKESKTKQVVNSSTCRLLSSEFQNQS
jgi:hypothetical protein